MLDTDWLSGCDHVLSNICSGLSYNKATHGGKLSGVGGWVVGRVCLKIKQDSLHGKLVQDEKKHSD